MDDESGSCPCLRLSQRPASERRAGCRAARRAERHRRDVERRCFGRDVNKRPNDRTASAEPGNADTGVSMRNAGMCDQGPAVIPPAGIAGADACDPTPSTCIGWWRTASAALVGQDGPRRRTRTRTAGDVISLRRFLAEDPSELARRDRPSWRRCSLGLLVLSDTVPQVRRYGPGRAVAPVLRAALGSLEDDESSAKGNRSPFHGF